MPDVTRPISRWAGTSVPIQTGTTSNLVGITFNSLLPWHGLRCHLLGIAKLCPLLRGDGASDANCLLHVQGLISATSFPSPIWWHLRRHTVSIAARAPPRVLRMGGEDASLEGACGEPGGKLSSFLLGASGQVFGSRHPRYCTRLGLELRSQGLGEEAS